MKATFFNEFHNSQAIAIVKDGRISAATADRLEEELCGLSGCSCQKWNRIVANGIQMVAEPEYDGGYTIERREEWQ
jgi:hypothetical protein